MKRFCIVFVVIASSLWAGLPLAHTSQSRPLPDFDQNGVVDISDFLLFVGKFGAKQGDEIYEDRFDLDGNGTVDISDFLIFVNDFGKVSPEGDDENDVNIPDANLRAVIADSLGKGRDEAITRAEMATLTSLEVQDANISDLTGLQFATNLTVLWLTGNPITDLSALCDLTNLTDLVLFGNTITDISALSNLTNLIHLNLNHNTVSDISVLSNLTNLEWLFLADNAITDISALSNLINLSGLDISGANITDISVLAKLTNLTQLALNDNCISDLSVLAKLTNLTHLNLSENRISDFSPLVANTGFGSGDEVEVRKNPLSPESLNTHIPALQSRGVDVQFDDQPVLVCIPILPQNLSVDAGSSHTLQANYLYIDREAIRPEGQRGYVTAVVYADFNQDGHIDVFYAPGDGWQHNTFSAELYLNDGAGCFSLDTNFFDGNPPRRLAPRKALPGDFNGDNRMDVFVLGHGYDKPPYPGEAPYVILSSPNGYVGSGLDTFIGFHHGGASADIDADGDIDVFITNSPFGTPFFLINDGSGSFTQDTDRIEGIIREQLYTAELVDVDGDDFLDLLAAGHEYDPHGGNLPTQILWGDNTGVFSTNRATILPSVSGRGIVVDIDVSDTDKDGDKDIVINRTGDESAAVYEGYYVQLVEQVGARRFEDKTAQLISSYEDAEAEWFDWIRMCDCNGDGHVDIVVDDAARNLIWENDGIGAFRPR
ncbi:MAG: leucine-rich repeat domain-containing protein [Gemmatimonadetes bacterium]|nr:leucine-rich repeat domain-containing protein [Gemmatimonadota bacterium]